MQGESFEAAAYSAREELDSIKRPTVSGPIGNQIDRQRDILERLDHQVSRLIAQLEPVLGDNYPRPSEAAEDRPSMAPLANTLYSINDKLDEIVSTLAIVHDRIEL